MNLHFHEFFELALQKGLFLCISSSHDMSSPLSFYSKCCSPILYTIPHFLYHMIDKLLQIVIGHSKRKNTVCQKIHTFMHTYKLYQMMMSTIIRKSINKRFVLECPITI